MAKLIVTLGKEVLQELDVDKERVTVGRRPHNDIVIENLAISGEHAAFVTVGNDTLLEDLNSTNGTLVNGQPVAKHFLQNGDLVELNKYKIRFVTDEAIAQPSPEAKAEPISSHATAWLKVLNGPNANKELTLTKDQTTLGQPGVQVAVIKRLPTGFILAHVEGTSRPVINGMPIGEAPQVLQDGDVIDIAKTQLQFSVSPV